ncbi:hypothetical protein HNQ71_004224 [Mesorhizobium sangaii]|uniref:Uncharacterized protein n=1 Tax=Mesorhizobium sangaii TaxID=505389 RepID=A0A841P8R0_9HYPH|nr:hypothetical protein [Mesorhizobium sangaii]
MCWRRRLRPVKRVHRILRRGLMQRSVQTYLKRVRDLSLRWLGDVEAEGGGRLPSIVSMVIPNL